MCVTIGGSLLRKECDKRLRQPERSSEALYFLYLNFLSYNNAATRTTKQEPALCTSAPVVGFKTPLTERKTATKLMTIDSVMLALMVFTVALDSRFR